MTYLMLVLVLALVGVVVVLVDARGDGVPCDPAADRSRSAFADPRAAALALTQRGALVATVLVLREVHGLSPAEIACRTGFAIDTIERCLAVARRTPSRRRLAER